MKVKIEYTIEPSMSELNAMAWFLDGTNWLKRVNASYLTRSS